MARLPKALKTGNRRQEVWRDVSSGVGKVDYTELKETKETTKYVKGEMMRDVLGAEDYDAAVKRTAARIANRHSG